METRRSSRSSRKSSQSNQKPNSEEDDRGSPEKRRKMTPVKKDQLATPAAAETVENFQTSKETKTEMKCRRSSFVRGRSRKSIGATNTDVTEIHTRIPAAVPPEERLRLLKLACYEYTINKLHEEFPILETIEDFRPKAKAEFEKSLQDLVEDGTLKAACYSQSHSENPANLEMATQISQLDREIHRLEEEGKQWDEMVTLYTQKAEEAARSENIAVPTKEPATLSVAQRKLISELPDLEAICAWAGKSQEKVALQIVDLASTAKHLKKIKCSISDFLAQETLYLAQESCRGYAAIEDPIELLLKSGK